MFVKTQTVKAGTGKAYTYYRLAQSYREKGKVKHHIVAELGALTAQEAAKLARGFARIAGIELSDDLQGVETVGTSYFGPPVLVERLMDPLGLSRWVAEAVREQAPVELDVVAALKVMLCAHLFKSGSRSECAVWDWQQKLFWHPHRVPDLRYDQFLRALNALLKVKDKIEEQLVSRLVSLFDLRVDLVLYALTSTYVEGQADWSQLLKPGHFRDKRGDCKQVVIGLAVTGEGFPVTFRVFEGNGLDKKTLEEMVQDIQKRFSVGRCVWVSDAGRIREEDLQTLEASGYEYILDLGSGGDRRDVQEAFGKTKELAQREFKETRFWEIALALPEKAVAAPEAISRRILVVESEARQQKTAAIFERRLERVRQGFQNLEMEVRQRKYVEPEDIRLQAEKILHGSGVKPYFSYKAEKGKVLWQENREAVEERKANAGKYALLAKSRLPAEEVLSAYGTLIVAEDVFRALEDTVDLRPVWDKCAVNVPGHILLTVWSYLLYRTLEAYLERAGMDLTAYRALNAVKEVRAVEVALRDRAIWKLMRVPPEAKEVFDAVGLGDFKARFEQWAVDAPPYHYRPRSIAKTREPPQVSEEREMEM